jgi:hypothetical protein
MGSSWLRITKLFNNLTYKMELTVNEYKTKLLYGKRVGNVLDG